MMPMAMLPGWLQRVAIYNPITYAADGIRTLLNSGFDAVILDMMMPGLNGLETLTRMLSIDPDLQVIMLTGHATVRDGVAAMKAGAVDYLEKPAKMEALLEKIKKAKRS